MRRIRITHHREVHWLETDIPRTNFDQDVLNSLGAFTTVCQIQRHDAEARVRAMQSNGWKATGVKPAPPRPTMRAKKRSTKPLPAT